MAPANLSALDGTADKLESKNRSGGAKSVSGRRHGFVLGPSWKQALCCHSQDYAVSQSPRTRKAYGHRMSDDHERMSDMDDQYHLAEYTQMEQWLDDHPEFVHDYFARKASRSMVDGWLLSHAVMQSTSPSSSSGAQVAQDLPPPNGSNSNSGANTPVRKISAQEFERGGQFLKPMVSTVDGTPTFLLVDENATENDKNQNRKSRSELKALDERELMYELVMDICRDLDVTSLCHKILQNVGILLNADRCSLFLVQGEKGSNSQCLVSKLFDVTVHSSLRDCVDKCRKIQIPWATGIIGHVAKTGEPLNIPNAYEVAVSSSVTSPDITYDIQIRSVLTYD
ncbi:hypothetical protein LSH36_26g12023 [Paralvinella palmiformis]|uniref:GAF domain-containing protein n=1 Tax=Paralvinella palmiformis TaxID=53620 RepID=A0AAD9NGN5_9ANNE|nr:hypothetical protein LSH36_26g12023 [Paralvinella palmiformis]